MSPVAAVWGVGVVETQFGADLFNGFEWAQAESPGSVVSVTNESQLLAALDNSGDIIDLGGNTITLSDQILLADNAALTTIQNGGLSGGRIYKGNTAKWRLRNLDINAGIPDNVKPDGGFLDIDGCNIHNAPNQGILVHADDIVIRNCRVHNNGDTANQDHGAYLADGSRALIFNCAFYNNQAYQVQLYPQYHSILMVCCTMYGGVTRGGVVIGSENVTPTSDVQVIGCIAMNSQTFGYEQYQTVTNVELIDCVGFNNVSGNFDSGTWTVTRPVSGNPNFVNAASGDFRPQAGGSAVGVIDSSLWNLVPATDIDGIPRVTADAGAFASI